MSDIIHKIKSMLRKNKEDYLGLTLIKSGKWMARVRDGQETLFLGVFEKINDAINVVDNKIIELRGSNAITNRKLIQDGILNEPNQSLNFKPYKVESLPNETWKEVKNYEGYYQISNFGRVKSIYREIPINKKTHDLTFVSERILVPKISNGYLRVCLSKEDERRMFSIHRLVGCAFIPNPNNYPEINHIDCNKSNNCVENLEWVNKQQNGFHRWKTSGNFKNNINVNKDYIIMSETHATKLNKEKVLKIRELYNSGKYTHLELSKQFNVERRSIGNIINRVSWKHI